MRAGWRYVITPRAERDLRQLDRTVRQRVFEALDRYIATGRGDARRLVGSADEWRLRVGDWRIRYRLDEAVQLMVVLSIRHRP